MDDELDFTGNVQKLTLEAAPIERGTFTDKEGKKEFLYEINYSQTGEIISKLHPDRLENYIYHENQLICIHVARPDKSPLYKIDYFYEDNLLIKRSKTNEQGLVTENETFHYNLEGQLSEKRSLTMTYEYIYEDDLLVEERWHSEFSLNQIIRYSYIDKQLTERAYFSGEDIPGRKFIYKRDKNGFITEEIVYSTSNLIVSHFKYEYITIYKKNWLKRIKYTLHSQNRSKKATEVQYRDFKFFPEEPIQQPIDNITEPEASRTEQEITFDNGLYKGEIVNGEMHGQGQFIFNTGTKYEGSFKRNSMEGRGKLTYINGKVYEGTFKNNALEGPGACKWVNGDFYAGEFKEGKMHGRGCYIWKNGNRFEGIFENNRRTEQGILYKKSELDSDAPPKWVNELFK